MNIPLILLATLTTGLVDTPRDLPSSYDESKLVLLVLSEESGDAAVEFRIAYADGDSTGFSPITYVTGTTPFKLEFDRPLLLAMISGVTNEGRIRVDLDHYSYGVRTNGVNGTGPLNVVRANGRRLGYGIQWPGTMH